MAIHTFDAARFISGLNAKSVYCCEYNPSWSWYKGNANAVCIFEFENGAVFEYSGTWCAKGLITSWDSQWDVCCSNGSVHWDGYNSMYEENEKAERTEIQKNQIELIRHQGCINDMIEALKNNSRPQTDCRDNIKSVEMMFKAIESAKTGKKVEF